ncbi:MAG: NUDIX hydrolase [Chloroflexi bacterium]|nr:NUDIX hydrolase [Chloroflexota bacterium]MBU1748095.1 NUDIX hydrolase [Chloroflexota bacterium]MBU1878705.1 NUDIX hydrolase [Chloroflexota bacterium]
MAPFAPIDNAELLHLTARYGEPLRATVEVEGDAYLYASRLGRTRDRRGEVVMAVERPGRRLLLHRKSWYGQDVYRLLSGGIGWDEPVAEALAREMHEETGLTLTTARLLGVIDCRIQYDGHTLPFVSYVFAVPQTEGPLQRQEAEIAQFQEVPIAELPAVIEHLHSLLAPRAGWGRWRAVAHELVYQALGE